MVLILSYLIIYNLTSLVLFASLMQILTKNLKTLFSLSKLGPTSFLSKILSIAFLSLAGVPPFIGFFSKIFIFVLISNSYFYLLFIPFFILLFIGLYFYVQNLRFLNSTNRVETTLICEISVRQPLLYFTVILPLTTFLIFGAIFIDDLIVFTLWLLV